jgi:MFS superfamily sulfate permease-like transporter
VITITVINDAAGARTQAAGLIAASVVASLVLLFAPILGPLPKALLGAIVMAAAISLFDLRGFVRISRVRPSEG